MTIVGNILLIIKIFCVVIVANRDVIETSIIAFSGWFGGLWLFGATFDKLKEDFGMK
ncbi:hypothetical protein Oweho_0011 [Owenweeksia hongkongensis DSM 17368]|uniref:Uncharacterized protein n=1 Tax=Owenweeksia hongkongensis (strain DSM 17368 / CIP 108786 / JCM 12287 / NRRL B-23963 / UST20020801) TaxID=926562 RepID=G8R527_OWEHD|nr:hypothetical protein Oweho_0011 [Owenweeksia hongkongensis DSM 17368]